MKIPIEAEGNEENKLRLKLELEKHQRKAEKGYATLWEDREKAQKSWNLKNRLPNASSLDPNANHTNFPSLVSLASRFPNLIAESKMQKLDDELRRFRIVTLPFHHKEVTPEEFWGKLSNVKDGGGNPQFRNICTFMHSLLPLPHANVDVERIFSSVNLIKTKTWNRLHTGTIRSLLKVKDGVKTSGGCVNFSRSSSIKQRMQSETLYQCSSFDEDELDHKWLKLMENHSILQLHWYTAQYYH